jgi:hypothetical protein
VIREPPVKSFSVGCRIIVWGPGYKDVEFAVQKIVPIGERLQFELFNAFKRPNQLFAAPGPQNSNNATVFGTPSFGFCHCSASY